MWLLCYHLWLQAYYQASLNVFRLGQAKFNQSSSQDIRMTTHITRWQYVKHQHICAVYNFAHRTVLDSKDVHLPANVLKQYDRLASPDVIIICKSVQQFDP